jgi:hypothetical protein
MYPGGPKKGYFFGPGGPKKGYFYIFSRKFSACGAEASPARRPASG